METKEQNRNRADISRDLHQHLIPNRKVFGILLRSTLGEWHTDKAPRMAAALAYYTIFAITPLLLVAITVAGSVYGEQAAQGEIVKQLEGLVGSENARAVQALIQSASLPAKGAVASIIAVVILLFGASGVFTELLDGLNTIWEVKPHPEEVFGNSFLIASSVLS